MVQSTDDISTKLKYFNLNSNQFLKSYDIKSLLTNISLSYTINIITNYMYSPRHKHPPIKKIFSLNGWIYQPKVCFHIISYINK